MTAGEAGAIRVRVNQEPKAVVRIDELADSSFRALAATAGASSSIADRTGSIFGDRAYDLRVPKAWPMTMGSAPYYDPPGRDDLLDWSSSYTQVYPLALGAGFSVIGGQPNAEAVIES